MLVVQLYPTLCDPVDGNPPGSSVRGILQARVLGRFAISFSRGIFPTQESNPALLYCRQTTGALLTSPDSVGKIPVFDPATDCWCDPLL